MYGPRALAVVLSGRLRDGTRGVRAIKDAGGRVIVQDPASAEQGSMPWNALATGCVDLVLEPAQIAGRAGRAGHGPRSVRAVRGARRVLGIVVVRGGRYNQILMALPQAERAAVTRAADAVAALAGSRVYDQGERIASVVFPLSGVFTLVVESPDAPAVEIATVGREGFVGLPVFLQATLTGVHTARSRIAGEALRIDAADFLDVGQRRPELRAALQRYAMALMSQIARAAACHRLHDDEQRAAAGSCRPMTAWTAIASGWASPSLPILGRARRRGPGAMMYDGEWIDRP